MQPLLPLHYWCETVSAPQLCLLYPCAADVCKRKMNRVLLMFNKCLAPSRDLFLLLQGSGEEEHNLLLSRPHWLFSSHRNVSHRKCKALFFWVRKPRENMQLSSFVLKRNKSALSFPFEAQSLALQRLCKKEGHLQAKWSAVRNSSSWERSGWKNHFKLSFAVCAPALGPSSQLW